jgi:thiol:disulfide interchange protein DsbD
MKKWFLLSLLIFKIVLCPVLHAEPPSAAEIFSVAVKKIDPNNFVVDWQIKAHYFLYRDRIQFFPQSDSLIHLGNPRFPSPLQHKDKQGQVLNIYRHHISIPVGLLANKSGKTLVYLHYQGCADDGFCYPPQVKPIQIVIDKHLALSQIFFKEAPLVQKVISPPLGQSEDISQIFIQHGWLNILLIFFGFGLLLSFTPCILPMIPVLSGIIVGHGKKITATKAFFLSLSYVFSMSVTYAVVGAVVALVGSNLQISMQSPWVISALSLLFILLALSMFGFYELKLPNAWQEKIIGSNPTRRAGHYWGAAIMGSLSTLVLSPCVTPPLIGVLTYIAETGNVFLGSLTLFFLSLGMGTPLLLIGTSAGKYLPQSGSWMNAIRTFFGLLLIAVAIYLMGRILSPAWTMMAWACLLIFSGIYAGALTISRTNKEKFYQGLGILFLLYGVLIVVGFSMGSTNPLQPLALYSTHANTMDMIEEDHAIPYTLSGLIQGIKNAKGTPVMLDFYADWCASCKLMEATTLKNKKVRQALAHFKVIKVDLTANNAHDKDIMAYFHVVAPPMFLFFNAEGKALPDLTLVGESTVETFLRLLRQVR